MSSGDRAAARVHGGSEGCRRVGAGGFVVVAGGGGGWMCGCDFGGIWPGLPGELPGRGEGSELLRGSPRAAARPRPACHL
jgi:hypothetical protein